MSRNGQLFDTAKAMGPLITTGALAVKQALARYRMPVTPERALQDAVETALFREGFNPQREVTRGDDRIDFLVGSVGVELKVKGSVGDVIRQLARYAAWPDITELLLVTTQQGHIDSRLAEIGGKPLFFHLARGTF